jgi:hypothetical protein
MRGWERWLFGAAIAVALFIGGAVVGKYRFWPYEHLNATADAGRALWRMVWPENSPRSRSPHRATGIVRWERGATQDGLTFMLYDNDDGEGAVLIDMDGTEVHRWQLRYSDAFADTPHLIADAPDNLIVGRGAHLYPNGDLLFSFIGGTFPEGGGLVMLDKDSRIKWTLARNTHHDLEVQPDGRIVVLVHDYLAEGVPACNQFVSPPYLADSVLTVSPEGEVLDSFSLAEALCESPFRTTLMPIGVNAQAPSLPPETEDFQHANTIKVVKPEQSAVFPMAAPGDYLVSLHHLNSVAVVDAATKRVKWYLVGHFVRQHDPDILPNGNLLIFDNLGMPTEMAKDRGRSRVIEIDPTAQQIVWQYSGGTTPEEKFDVRVSGQQQKLANGNVLISAEFLGRVIEVTGDPEPRIVWEYVNIVDVDENGGVAGAIGNALRFAREDLPFLEPSS